MTRSEAGAQRTFDASRLFRVDLWINGDKVDISSVGGKMSAGFNTTSASAERDDTRRRTTAGQMSALVSGEAGEPRAWPYAVHRMPLGYGPILDDRRKPLTRAGGKNGRWKLIGVDLDEVDAVREMLRLVAEGRPWPECAVPLVEARVRCRGPQWEKFTYDQVEEPLGRTVANMVAYPGNLELWLTGKYSRLIEVPVYSEGDFEGFEVQPKHGTFGHVAIESDFGLPDGGFLDEDTAAAIRARLGSRELKDAEQVDDYSLLSWLKSYRDCDGDDFTWERHLTKAAAYYVVRQRDRRAAIGRSGKARGWRPGEGKIVLTVGRVELEAALANAIRLAVAAVADQRLLVHIRAAGATDRLAGLEERLRETEVSAGRLRGEAETSDRLAGLAVSGARPDEAAARRHMITASDKHKAADEQQSAATRLRSEIDQLREHDEEQVVVDLSSPVAVGAYIEGHIGQNVPLAIGQVLRQLGLETLRLEVDPHNDRKVNWSLELNLPTINGARVTLPVSGVVRNRHRDPAGAVGSAEKVDAAIAEEFLRNPAELEDLTASFGKTRPQVVDSIRRHLSRTGFFKRGLRSAVVDMPAAFAETRLALAGHVLGAPEIAEHLGAFGSYVVARYTSDLRHPNAYVRRDTTLARKALRVMSEASAEVLTAGIPIERLARSLGVSRTQVSYLCGDRSKSGATKERLMGVLVRDQLNPGIVRMKQCPHPDCVAAEGHRWLSHYLPVPETDGYSGLLCPHCRRLPDPELAEVYFPDAYFDTFWEGPSDSAHCDLRRAPITFAAAPDRYRAGLPLSGVERVYSLREAAARLEITDGALRGWIKDLDDPLPSTRLSGPGGNIKYALTEATLEEAQGSVRHRQLLNSSPRPSGLQDAEYATLRELAAHVNVAEHYIRDRALRGEMGPTEYKNLNSIGAAHLVVARTVMNFDEPAAGTQLLPAGWIARHRDGLLLMAAAAELSRQTPSQIRAAVKAGALRSYVTDGGTHRFAREDVEEWAQARAEAPLTPQKAAALAGCSPDELRRAVAREELTAAKTAGGHLRFNAAVVRAWASLATS